MPCLQLLQSPLETTECEVRSIRNSATMRSLVCVRLLLLFFSSMLLSVGVSVWINGVLNGTLFLTRAELLDPYFTRESHRREFSTFAKVITFGSFLVFIGFLGIFSTKPQSKTTSVVVNVTMLCVIFLQFMVWGLTQINIDFSGNTMKSQLSSDIKVWTKWFGNHTVIYEMDPVYERLDFLQNVWKCCGYNDTSSWPEEDSNFYALPTPIPNTTCCLEIQSESCKFAIGLFEADIIREVGCERVLAEMLSSQQHFIRCTMISVSAMQLCTFMLSLSFGYLSTVTVTLFTNEHPLTPKPSTSNRRYGSTK